MKRPALVLAVALLLPGRGAGAEEGRFDAQVFRPSAAPRDLVMVQKSEVVAPFSPVLGFYQDIGFDPLVLVSGDTGDTIRAVAARYQLTALAALGVGYGVDIGLAVPIIPWQSSDNLRMIGTEGPIAPTALGDIRLSARWALPYLNRREHAHSGFGMALTGNLNLPTGSPMDFTGDGVLSYGMSVIGDYRFDFRTLITANLGIWFRPERQFAGVKVGDMASVGVAAETYLVQRWNLSVLGGLHGYPSLDTYPSSARQIPAEALLALRWHSSFGMTLTVGGSFGAACAFGAPSFRFFNGITFQPPTSREQKEINRLAKAARPEPLDDPDGDGLTGELDRCPDLPGPEANFGCPDVDSDGDDVVDREDKCPNVPAGKHGKDGCPLAYIKDDEIAILDKVHFATDKDEILAESMRVLEAVAQVLLDNPEFIVRIEGHTDARARAAYNLNLSQRRVNSVMADLIRRGVDPSRLEAKGLGHTQPLYDDTGCLAPDEELGPDCRFMTSENRRVVFRIISRAGTTPGQPQQAPQMPAPQQQAPQAPQPGIRMPQRRFGAPDFGPSLPAPTPASPPTSN